MLMPLCPRCAREMPNLEGALSIKGIICRICFYQKSDTVVTREKSSYQPLPESIDPRLLSLLNPTRGRTYAAALEALTLAVQQADREGVFSDPDHVLRNVTCDNSRLGINKGMYERARAILLREQLWIPFGVQQKGRNKAAGNKMKLGPRVAEIIRAT